MDKTKAIHNAVKAGLRVNPLVNDSGITVMNMDGDVTLTGVVTSYPQYLEAAAAARRVAGVRNVHNHLEVVLLPHDYRDDAMLTTEANNTLRANVTVPDSVEAIAHNGNLTLTGPSPPPRSSRTRWTTTQPPPTAARSRSTPTATR